MVDASASVSQPESESQSSSASSTRGQFAALEHKKQWRGPGCMRYTKYMEGKAQQNAAQATPKPVRTSFAPAPCFAGEADPRLARSCQKLLRPIRASLAVARSRGRRFEPRPKLLENGDADSSLAILPEAGEAGEAGSCLARGCQKLEMPLRDLPEVFRSWERRYAPRQKLPEVGCKEILRSGCEIRWGGHVHRSRHSGEPHLKGVGNQRSVCNQ